MNIDNKALEVAQQYNFEKQKNEDGVIMLNESKDKILNVQAKDTISHLEFSEKDKNLLLITSWDSSVQLYDVEQDQLNFKIQNDCPILSSCIIQNGQNQGKIAFGDIFSNLSIIDPQKKSVEVKICNHKDTISKVIFSKEYDLIISGGWDKTLYFYDMRLKEPVKTLILKDKILTMDIKNQKLIVLLKSQELAFLDLSNLSKIQLYYRKANIKGSRHISCLKLLPNGSGYAAGTPNGKIGIEYFEDYEFNYGFIAHVVNNDDQAIQYAYQVNQLVFKPQENNQSQFMASAGSDGYVKLWDYKKQKRTQQHKYSQTVGVNRLDFNRDGTKLALAVSYNFDDIQQQNQQENLIIPQHSVIIRG